MYKLIRNFIIAVISIYIICVGLYCLHQLGVINLNPEQTPKPTPIKQDLKLYVDGLNIIPVNYKRSDLDKIATLVAAKDKSGMDQILNDLNKTFYVSNNTKVIVITDQTYYKEIKIIDGDYKGLSGWVLAEWVKPL